VIEGGWRGKGAWARGHNFPPGLPGPLSHTRREAAGPYQCCLSLARIQRSCGVVLCHRYPSLRAPSACRQTRLFCLDLTLATSWRAVVLRAPVEVPACEPAQPSPESSQVGPIHVSVHMLVLLLLGCVNGLVR